MKPCNLKMKNFWRFEIFKIHGITLRYSTHNNAGRITNSNEIYTLANGGKTIYENYFYWSDAHRIRTTYRRYNPKPNTYFVVSNKDNHYMPNNDNCTISVTIYFPQKCYIDFLNKHFFFFNSSKIERIITKWKKTFFTWLRLKKIYYLT